jgi:hypothetical protein
MERRTLSAAVNTVPNVDPETVREFVTQERRAKPDLADMPLEPVRAVPEAPKRRRNKMAGVTPIGLIPVTVRLRPELAGALKRASLERQLHGETLFTQQDLVEQALEPWLRQQGYLN